MVEKNMVTLTERTIMKSRSGVYSDTAENRRKHRVGQKYGAEKQSDDGEKTEKKETDPAKELEAVNKVIAAINEGKLNLPAAEVMKLSEKKQKLEAAKKQAEKINAGVKANEEKKNAEEAKETSKKINEAQKKETEKKEESSSKKYAEMDIKEAKKELVGKEITFKGYWGDGEDAKGKIESVRLSGKAKQPVATVLLSNGSDEVVISLEQLDKRKAGQFGIEFGGKKEEPKNKEKSEQKPSDKAPEADEDDLREARRKLSYLQDNEERLIKRDGKEKYDERLKQAKDEVEKLKGDTPKEEPKSEPKQSEAEESYTRIKFDDVPNSGKINLKKYLSEKVRKGVDEKWSNIKNIPTENLKKMEKGLVNDLNKNFEAIKKSQRAELLYSIMKVKGELESRGKENKGEQSLPKLYSGGKISGTKNEYSKNLNDVLNSENADSIVIPEHKLQGWHDTEDALAGTNWKVSREVDKNGNYELGGKYYIFHKKK